MASAGPYASLHLAPDRNHASTLPLSFLQAGCPSCHPINSVKALKAAQKREPTKDYQWIKMFHTQNFVIKIKFFCKKKYRNRGNYIVYTNIQKQHASVTVTAKHSTKKSIWQTVSAYLNMVNYSVKFTQTQAISHYTESNSSHTGFKPWWVYEPPRYAANYYSNENKIIYTVSR